MARRPSDPPPAPPIDDDIIRIVGAREHNLQNVSVELPKGRLICLTGVSGSGKSSLAFDTLYAEGQRRYIESLSSYARQFLGELPKPEVDQITGLSPAISIQQKTSGWNPRSTVGTVTQIHDYIRVLYARAGDAHCPKCGNPITAQTREQMLASVLAMPAGTAIMLLAPKARAQKGEHRDLFDELLRRGFVRARVDGQIFELSQAPALDRYRRHDIEVVIDRLVVRPENRTRINEALELALTEGNGVAIASPAEATKRSVRETAPPADTAAENDGEREAEGEETGPSASDDQTAPVRIAAGDTLLSAAYACTQCQLSFEPPSPQLFSFNSPQGMCPACDGLGTKFDFVPELLVPDATRNFQHPCIAPLRQKLGRWPMHIYEGVARHIGFDLKQPWEALPKKARDALLFGTGDQHITFEWKTRQGIHRHGGQFAGVIAELQTRYKKAESAWVRGYYEEFMRSQQCPLCHGARLTPEALAVTLRGRSGPDAPLEALNIHSLCTLAIDRARHFFETIELAGVRKLVGEEPLKEIRARLGFLLDVGLTYLTLDRSAPTLSGGESQRIRLASQIGSGLVGVLYVLDEPSIGLHPRDNLRLLDSLKRLRDLGNTVVVVEHDRDTMEAADHLVDFGPGAGVRGGRVTAAGDLATVAQATESVTGAYLSGRQRIETPAARRPITNGPPDAVASPEPAKAVLSRKKSRTSQNTSDV